MTDPLRSALSPDAPDNAPPPALLPDQQRWVADDSPLKSGEKSRRIGLTWGEAADDALIASAADGSNVFYISATQDMAIEYIEAVAMWAKVYDLAAGEIEEGVFIDGDKEIKTYKVDFPKSGHRPPSLPPHLLKTTGWNLRRSSQTIPQPPGTRLSPQPWHAEPPAMPRVPHRSTRDAHTTGYQDIPPQPRLRARGSSHKEDQTAS